MITLDGKNVLVTGGTGTIGSALVRRLLKRGCHVRVLSRNDTHQHELKHSLSTADRQRVEFHLGDVRDTGAVIRAVAGMDVVFHCAAIKHVNAATANPSEASSINVHGTANVLTFFNSECAMRNVTGRFTLLSTDKAAAPSSVMGMTKAIAEHIVMGSGFPRVERSVVRFGNVWRSNGSVVPTWERALKNGDRIRVTDWDVTRYIITIDEAVDALVHAHGLARVKFPKLFVPRMEKLTLRQIYDVVTDNAPDSDVQVIGLQPGEKLHEAGLSITERNMLENITYSGATISFGGTWDCDDPNVWQQYASSHMAPDRDPKALP